MKELTIEQKAKAYDEALQRATKWYDANTNEGYRGIFEEIFPELKESEDESIRKGLIKFVSAVIRGNDDAELSGVLAKDCLAWLEKQGESDETKAKMFLINKGYPIDTNGTFPIYEEMYDIIKERLEKQGEQKPEGKTAQEAAKEKKVDNQNCIKSYAQEHIGDKVEPKFKVGDWVTNGDYTWKIVEVKPLDYILQSQDGNIVDDTISHVDEQFHFFTIEDAKDGDVLFVKPTENLGKQLIIFGGIDSDSRIKYYCRFLNNKFSINDGLMGYDHKYFLSATKEQRDLLFQKMKETGYEWDAEKKELKEIEQKPVIEMKTPEESLGIDSDTYNKIVDECIYGEQKPADVEEISFFEDFRKTDSEVEPKFKVEKDKWYVCISQFCYCIEGGVYKATSDSRIIDDFGTEYDMHSDAYKYFRLWTIQDAKDGDVLVDECGIYIFNSFVSLDDKLFICKCAYQYSKKVFEIGGMLCKKADVCPATKEQHDTLMKVMTDAGYTFDFEKKELKKIEQKPVIEMKTPEESLGIDSDTYNKIVDECIYGEQKPADVEEISFFEDFRKTDSEVEPKFKVEKDKWYVCISQYCNCIEGRNYKASLDGRIIDDYGTEYDMHDDAYRWFRPWTIQDANPGDVLAAPECYVIFKKIDGLNIKCYCTYHYMGFNPSFHINTLQNKTAFHPATKEQRDTLMKAIADAGYTFDFEKKELKKIEQSPVDVRTTSYCHVKDVEQKPAWSEKDDEIIEEIINDIECARAINYHAPKEGYEFRENWLESIKDRVQPQPQQEWSKEDETKIKSIITLLKSPVLCTMDGNKGIIDESIKYLKSIKYRVQPKQEWKPSNEQLNNILDVLSFDNCTPKRRELLESLYHDLKKLVNEK